MTFFSYYLLGVDYIEKIKCLILIILFIISFNFNIVKANDEKAVITFEEVENEIKKLDYYLLIGGPLIIIGVGTIYYFKNNKKMKIKTR